MVGGLGEKRYLEKFGGTNDGIQLLYTGLQKDDELL
jgi:hypothetical protein